MLSRPLLALAFAPALIAADASDVPRLGPLTIDGDDADWAGKGLVFAHGAEDGFFAADPGDGSAEARVGWTDEGLGVLVTVHDDQWVESEEARTAYEGDSVELFLRPGAEWKELVQPIVSPGMSDQHAELRSYIWDYRGPADQWKDAPLTVRAARQRIDGGYRLEALIPWASIRFAAKPDATCEFRVNVNDLDRGHPRRQVTWTGPDGNAFHRLRLADGAGVPLDGGAWIAENEDFSEVAADAIGPAAWAGKPLTLRQGESVLASGTLIAEGDRAIGHVAAPASLVRKKVPMQVLVDGQAAGTRTFDQTAAEYARMLIHGARWQRRWMDEDTWRIVRRASPQAPQVFAGETLPRFAFPDLRQPRLAGVTGVETTYYDAAFHPVTRAATPGRYGAIVTVAFGKGEPLTLERTLYRRPDGDFPPPPETPEFAQALGLPASADAGTLRRAFGPRWSEAIVSEDGAQILAAIAEAPAGARPRPDFQHRHWWHELHKTLGDATKYEAFPFLPKGYDAKGEKRWPLILWLHGSGNYPPLEKRNPHDGLIGWAEKQDGFPFVVLALQSFGWWESPAVAEFVQRALADYRVDPDRVYLMGFSMGGYGTWQAIVDYPELFAAAVPIGGGKGQEQEVARIAELPVWIFNGEADYATRIEDARLMSDSLHAVGGRVRLTTFPGLDHLGSPGAAWSTPGLWEWLLQQKRGAPSQAKAAPMGPPAP
jgi:predicted esterase